MIQKSYHQSHSFPPSTAVNSKQHQYLAAGAFCWDAGGVCSTHQAHRGVTEVWEQKGKLRHCWQLVQRVRSQERSSSSLDPRKLRPWFWQITSGAWDGLTKGKGLLMPSSWRALKSWEGLGREEQQKTDHRQKHLPEKLSQGELSPITSWACMLYRAMTCQEADKEIILSKCIFLPLACRQSHTDKERPLVMLEGFCLSSLSEHPSQPETNILVALTSAVIAFLQSMRKIQAYHNNIWYSDSGEWLCQTCGVQKNWQSYGLRSCPHPASPVAAIWAPAWSWAQKYDSAWEESVAMWNMCLEIHIQAGTSVSASSVWTEAGARNSGSLSEPSHTRRCHIPLAQPWQRSILHSAAGRSDFSFCWIQPQKPQNPDVNRKDGGVCIRAFSR